MVQTENKSFFDKIKHWSSGVEIRDFSATGRRRPFLRNTLRGVPRLAKTDIATFYFSA